MEQTTVYEVHGNDGSSPLTHAEHLLLKEHPEAQVVDTGFNGARCEHGSLLVAVTWKPRTQTT